MHASWDRRARTDEVQPLAIATPLCVPALFFMFRTLFGGGSFADPPPDANVSEAAPDQP